MGIEHAVDGETPIARGERQRGDIHARPELEVGGAIQRPVATTLAQIEPLENGANRVTLDLARETGRESDAVADLRSGIERDERVVACRDRETRGWKPCRTRHR